MKKRIYLFGAVVAVMMASCSTTDTPEPIPAEPQTPVAEEIVLPEPDINAISQQDIDRSTDFALRLLNAGLEINEDKNKNMVISPVSIFSALSMAVNGADDNAKSKILMALGYDANTDLKEINELNYHIVNALPQLDPEKVKLEFSNSYWIQNGYCILESYKKPLEAYYNAIDADCDPNGIDGMKAINAFVEDKTHGMIKDFLKSPKDDTKIALLNTAYLKAEWENKFDPEFTYDGFFYNIDGTKAEINYMYNEKEFPFSSIDGINCITLPYGNGNYSMTLFYPDNIDITESDILSFDEMMQRLTSIKIKELLSNQKKVTVHLNMPKFECEDTPNFSEILSKLNLLNLPSFNFIFNTKDGTTPSLILNEGEHAAKIKVNEDGTEAGGATLLGFIEGTGNSLIVHINRPFVYLVREESTGIVLFAGAMTQFYIPSVD